MCAYTHVRTREAYTPHLPYLACHPDVSLPNTTPSLNAFRNFKSHDSKFIKNIALGQGLIDRVGTENLTAEQLYSLVETFFAL